MASNKQTFRLGFFSIFLAASLAKIPLAHAGGVASSFAFQIGPDSNGKAQCLPTANGTGLVNANAGTASIAVTNQAIVPETYSITAGATAKKDVAYPPDGVVQFENVTGNKLTIAVKVKDVNDSVVCTATLNTGAPPPQDLVAAKWWQKFGATALDELRHQESDVTFLVHLPSGSPAFPFPASVREGKKLQVVVIVPNPQEQPIAFESTSCADVQIFRIKPSADNGVRQSGTGNEPNQDSFAVLPVGKMSECGAGTASYNLKLGAAEASSTISTSLRVRSVYHFAATFVAGYDTAPKKEFAVSSEGGTAHIVENPNRVGLAAYIGGVWMVGGVDYEDMKWYNYFLNPFVAFNPTSPTTDAVAGLSISPTGGISLALGVSVHKNTALNGVSVGDEFTGTGAVPTRETWAGMKPGFFAGLTVDSNVYAAVKALGTTK